MSDDSSAKEYFEKLKIVEKFCGGDVESAKKVVKGEYYDIIAIKGRFKDSTDFYFGIFLIFLSRITHKVMARYAIVSESISAYNHKPFDDWKTFLSKLKKERDDGVFDMHKSNLTNEVFKRLEELNLYESLFNYINGNDIQSLTEKFELILEKTIKVEKTIVTIDFEDTSSLLLHEDLGLSPP